MTEYITIFEIPSKWTDYYIVLSISCAIIGLGLAAVMIIYTLKNWRNWQKDKKLKKQAVLAILFLLIWGGVWLFGTFADSHNIKFGKKLIEAYYSGNYEIIEGIVKVLHQQPKSGHDSGDLVRINQRDIEFSYFRSTPAYRQTISHGGVLKDGVYAKIYIYKGNILRIDIPKAEGKLSSDK